MKLFRIITIVVCIPPVLIAGLLLIFFAEKLLGYFPGSPGWEVAEMLVKESRSVNECLKIIDVPWIGIGPASYEQRALCIHEYATLAKDPSACELLMPSKYGLSCVGAATKNMPCLFDDQKNVVWNDGEYHEVPYEECKNVDTEMGSACCDAAASKFDPDFIHGCGAFNSYDPLLSDYCQREVARKTLNPESCNAVKDTNIREACFITVRAIKEHPELRENYPFLQP